MRHFYRLAHGIDVAPLMLAITRQPALWGQNSLRVKMVDSPHAQADDIWVRYNAPEKADSADFTDLHFPVWYPAYATLPQLRPLIFSLMARVEAVHLGGVLITKIPPGASILPHVDSGWHPEFYNCKLYVPLQTNSQCINYAEDESVVMAQGDCWYFNNTVMHSVVNDGDTDRVTLIICMRCEG